MPKIGSYYLHPVPPVVPAKETLSWLTEVQTSHNGTEYREQLRALPRRALEYTYYESTNGVRQAGYLTQYAGVGQLWAVPLWHEVEILDVANGTHIDAEVGYRDYAVGDSVLLWSSPTSWEAAVIAGLPTSGGITTTAPVAARPDARVMPLKQGRVDQSIVRRVNNVTAMAAIRFELDDQQDVAPITPAQYSGADIYYECPLLSGDTVDVGLVQQLDVIDGDLGNVVTRARWATAKDARVHRRVLVGVQALHAFRGYLARRAGKYRDFWTPTHDRDLRNRSTGTVTTTLFVDNDDVVDMGLTHIAVQSTVWTWTAHQVTANVPATGGRAELTITPGLGYNANQILRISWLQRRRLDTDTVEIHHIGRDITEITVTTSTT